LARVPQPPADLDECFPLGFSRIIMRLLEKEPDRRYQSADGLAYDLVTLAEGFARGESDIEILGSRDFPLRLSSPSRPVGREAEIAALREALATAMRGGKRGVFISGDPGVGKTVLINELRPIVTASRGWVISGKFDQYRQGASASGAVVQALRALGRLLLAEPEADLANFRAAFLATLGHDAGLITALLPEFETLLGSIEKPAILDPMEARARLGAAMLQLLQTAGSLARPIVVVLDDLQWANQTSMRFIESMLTDDSLTGLMLVGAYRGGELDLAHPLSAMLLRWERLGIEPPVIELHPLPPAGLGALIHGNPYDSIEFVNALRRDGTLALHEDGWSWDAATVRRYVGGGDVVDLLASRIRNLPSSSRALLEVIACLGGDVTLALLGAGADLAPLRIEWRLVPTLEEGLLVFEGDDHRTGLQGFGIIRFRHDRVQQAVYSRIAVERKRSLHLAIARRLAAAECFQPESAEQYLVAIPALDETNECRRTAALFYDAALTSKLTANYSRAEQFLAAATALHDKLGTPRSDPDFGLMQNLRHAVLYGLGRYDEAHVVFAGITERSEDPIDIADAACGQVTSLSNRGRHADALALGLDLLKRLGVRPPDDVIRAQFQGRVEALYHWIAAADPDRDRSRPEMNDSRAIAASKILGRLCPVAFFSDKSTMMWLALESQRLWAEHGPCSALMTGFSCAGFVTIALRQDFRTADAIMRHLLEVGQARGYELGTAFVRNVFAIFGAQWFEPLEEGVSQSRRAREGLLRGAICRWLASATTPRSPRCWKRHPLWNRARLKRKLRWRSRLVRATHKRHRRSSLTANSLARCEARQPARAVFRTHPSMKRRSRRSCRRIRPRPPVITSAAPFQPQSSATRRAWRCTPKRHIR
jgi:hypothetical protein